ncbi:MAG: alkaline phosphatase family protein [Oscillochloridaceae bacterium umkhey_bin13]
MLNPESVAAVEAARFGSHLVHPIYDGYGFAAIPATLERLLTGSASGPGLPPAALAGLAEQYETVVLIFVDALGWRFFEPWAQQHPFLARFLADGVVSRLTTMFPSTTTVHVTAIHTDQTPGESGLFEWYMYEPSLDRVITPLLGSLAGEWGREGLEKTGLDLRTLYPQATLYQRLAAAGVRSTVYQHASYADSSYSKQVCAGAKMIPFRTLAEALVIMGDRLRHKPDPAYHILYLDSIDAIAHQHGPEAPHTAAEIDVVLTIFERHLHAMLSKLGRPVLLLLTADHGQIRIHPKRTLHLNQLLPELVSATRCGADGKPLAPVGSNRDMFLYLHPDQVAPMHARLSDLLVGRAEVHTSEALITAGFFGANVSMRLRERIGDLVILPYANETVWWDDQRFPVRFKGMHGGLTPEEAHTQLAALAYGAG